MRGQKFDMAPAQPHKNTPRGIEWRRGYIRRSLACQRPRIPHHTLHTMHSSGTHVCIGQKSAWIRQFHHEIMGVDGEMYSWVLLRGPDAFGVLWCVRKFNWRASLRWRSLMCMAFLWLRSSMVMRFGCRSFWCCVMFGLSRSFLLSWWLNFEFIVYQICNEKLNSNCRTDL